MVFFALRMREIYMLKTFDILALILPTVIIPENLMEIG